MKAGKGVFIRHGSVHNEEEGKFWLLNYALQNL